MRPWVLGLTGSIGMGKSTAAGFFREAGVPVWDADAAVHRLYQPGEAGSAAVAALCPEAAGPGGVDRARLRAWLEADGARLERLEAAIHPLLAADRAAFLARAEAAGAPLVVLDVPLLFETGLEAAVDSVAVVTAPPEVQRARVLARPGMTEAVFAALLARQLPDAEKRARADHVIEAVDKAATRAEVLRLAAELQKRARARDRA